MTLGASRIGFWYLNDPVNITWSTTQDGIVEECEQPGGWSITNQGRTIRFNVQDSMNCGGCNPNIQSGSATATISVGATPYLFYYNLTGLGEPEAPTYELMELRINGGAYNDVQLVTARSPGGEKGCAPAEPVVITQLVPQPLSLATGTDYTFTLNFTTNDNLFHINSYYECILSFTRN
jgi:hypothetical protein